MRRLHIGIDDHDSPEGGCTTHFAAIAVKLLFELGAVFEDYPLLVRLNPAIPWKTRGNAAVVLRVKLPEGRVEDAVEALVQASAEYRGATRHPTSSPGMVFAVDADPHVFRPLYRRALTDLVTPDLAHRYAEKLGVFVPREYRGARGVVGALSALGALLEGEDYTYELLAYRSPERWGSPRLIDPGSVKRMDAETRPRTFNNYDEEEGRVLITPRGLDPILVGIRGEDPHVLRRALRLLEIGEPLDAWLIYRSNQATDAHHVPRRVSELKPYRTGRLEATVVSHPRILPKGHVILRVADDTGTIDAAFYEPTRVLPRVARKLVPGDRLRLSGVVKPASSTRGVTFNVEKMEITKLAEAYRLANPRCPRCGARMTSAGKGKGFKCRKCGYRDPQAQKEKIPLHRNLSKGIYVAAPSAMGHLVKPLERLGNEKTGPPPPPRHREWAWYS